MPCGETEKLNVVVRGSPSGRIDGGGELGGKRGVQWCILEYLLKKS